MPFTLAFNVYLYDGNDAEMRRKLWRTTKNLAALHHAQEKKQTKK
jgi:hypothetical protein